MMGNGFGAAFGLAVVLAWAGPAAAEDALSALCRTNPAYSPAVMRAVLAAQLQRDHDDALDAEPPDQLAAEAVEQGVKECGDALSHDAKLAGVLAGFSGADQKVAWDAFNTSCADHVGTRAECVSAEVGSVRALKRMASQDQPPGAHALVQACELIMNADPPMADWRQCVDQALAVHASKDAAQRCETSVTWHVTKSGLEAGRILAGCLHGLK